MSHYGQGSFHSPPDTEFENRSEGPIPRAPHPTPPVVQQAPAPGRGPELWSKPKSEGIYVDFSAGPVLRTLPGHRRFYKLWSSGFLEISGILPFQTTEVSFDLFLFPKISRSLYTYIGISKK